jgi:hypothetical protein
MARRAILTEKTRTDMVRRLEQFRVMDLCAESAEDAIKFAKSVLNNPKVPIVIRFMAFDRLMNRAFGLPFQAIDVNMLAKSQHVEKVIHEVRWLPPDPNDKSKLIEHTDE